MLARARSFVSKFPMRSGCMMSLFCSEDRMDETAGLQISQPSPCSWAWLLPYWARIFWKVSTFEGSSSIRMSVISSCLECSKCSQMLLLRTPPMFLSSASRNFLTSGSQPPHPVPALEHFFTTGSVASSTPSSWMAALSWPTLTSLQEQTWALGSLRSASSSSSASPPRAEGGGSSMAAITPSGNGAGPSSWSELTASLCSLS
mmetsp:Transcript_4226/g.10972  ORF Transcript_4226/g.10972 Transcript_4226/m.10972 type:complete len:203 (+) Transcript_4226:1261-1869(+)